MVSLSTLETKIMTKLGTISFRYYANDDKDKNKARITDCATYIDARMALLSIRSMMLADGFKIKRESFDACRLVKRSYDDTEMTSIRILLPVN